MKFGIIGAGFIARAFAVHAIRHGHEVMLSNSRGPHTLRSAAVAVKCQVGTAEEAARFGDVVVLALPMSSYQSIPVESIGDKVLIDMNNYYPDRDGPMPELDAGVVTTSERIARHLPRAKLVKAFNAIMANDLQNGARPPGAPDRRALPIAGNDAAAKQLVASLIEAFGFDAVDAGPLSEGWRFERARPVYCVPFTKAALTAALATTREARVMEYSWRPQ